VPGCTTPGSAALSGLVSYAWAVSSTTRAALLLALALTAAACAPTPPASFDPSAPCTQDGSAPGAYPDLEAMVPATFENGPPLTLDSGRKCTIGGLGALSEAGIHEVHFAGGTWGFGGIRAAALAVFSAPGLTADDMADFYGKSATEADRTRITGVSTVTLAGRPGHRIDSLTGARQQTVLVWPAAKTDVVNVVITNDLPDPKIEAAVEAFAGQ
jgi:hypothetical protein